MRYNFPMKTKQILLATLLFFLVGNLLAEQNITTVLLIRHAEKSKTPPDNPVLTEEGKLRSENLVHVLGSAGIKTIYVSQWTRTHLTAEPIAKHLGIKPEQVDAADSKKLVDTILTKHAGETVLVVGHSDTVPEMIAALGGPSMPELGEFEFDNLFVVTVYAPGKASVVRLKYGK